MYVKSIYFERSGGFTGIQLKTHIELDDLPDDQKKEILNLLDELDIEDLAEEHWAKNPKPDEITYSLNVYSDKREYRILTSESSMPDEMEPLLKVMERIAKKRI